MGLSRSELELVKNINTGVQRIDGRLERHMENSNERHTHLERRVDCVERDVAVVRTKVARLEGKPNRGRRNNGGGIPNWQKIAAGAGVVIGTVITYLGVS